MQSHNNVHVLPVSRRLAWLVVLLLAPLAGCGIVGDKGAAIFHVGNGWQKGVGIALGSTFTVTATRNALLKTPLTVLATQPAVQKQADGRFKAVAEGPAQFQATDASGIAVDTVEFQVAAATSVALGAGWSNTLGAPLDLPQHFALVQGGRYVGAIVARDQAAQRLQHQGIAEATCPGAVVQVTDDYVEATPTTLGPTTATVTLRDATGAAKATASYQLDVVQPTSIAKLVLTSAGVQASASAPADPDKGPVPSDGSDSTTANKTQLFLLNVTATLQDGTPVYGAQLGWSESSPGHLLTKQSNGGNYAVLKSGEQVTVTATLGALSAQIELAAP